MKKLTILMICILLFSTVGCVSDTKPASKVQSAQKPQTAVTTEKPQEKPADQEKPMNQTKLQNEQTEPKMVYQPTKTRSKQKVIATFEVGSTACVINGKSMTMEGKVFSKRGKLDNEYAIYVPARNFALAAGISNGEFQMSKSGTSDKLSFTLNNTTVSGFSTNMEKDNYSFRHYLQLSTVFIDTTGIPYVSVIPFAKEFGYDIYWDGASGKVEFLEGLPLKTEDYEIGPFRFNLTEKELIQLFGKPESETDPAGIRGRDVYIFKDVYYSGVKLGLKSHRDVFYIYMITLTSPQYKTHRGIALGDSIDKVVAVYGMGYRFDKTENTYYYQPVSRYHERNYIAFTVENGKVKKIELIDHSVD